MSSEDLKLVIQKAIEVLGPGLEPVNQRYGTTRMGYYRTQDVAKRHKTVGRAYHVWRYMPSAYMAAP